ncbi:MAG: hypothetical protein ACLFPW_03945 [Spirochaetaceae bacterium]
MRLDVRRAGWTLYHETFTQWRRVLLSALAVAGAAMILSLLSWVGGNPASPRMAEQFAPFMIAWGVVVTSGVFGELREDAFRMEFLLRPASTMEKLFSKLLVSTLGYFVIFTVIYFTMSGVLRGIYALVFGSQGPGITSPLRLLWDVLLAYLVVHSWFFLGAVYFKSHNGIKTLLVVVGVGFTYALLTAGLGRLILDPFIHGEEAELLRQRFENIRAFEELPASITDTVKLYGTLGKAVLILSVPGFWLLSWRRLRETEG